MSGQCGRPRRGDQRQDPQAARLRHSGDFIGIRFHRNKWSERRDLNSGPPVPQTGALTGLRYAPPGQVACGVQVWLLLACLGRCRALIPTAGAGRKGESRDRVLLMASGPGRRRRGRGRSEGGQGVPSYSITSSAMASTLDGIVRPSALAVLRLITSSNLVGCTTGRSAGFSPLRMRPVYTPTR